MLNFFHKIMCSWPFQCQYGVYYIVAVIAPRTGKIIKNGPSVFGLFQKIGYKMVYYRVQLLQILIVG